MNAKLTEAHEASIAVRYIKHHEATFPRASRLLNESDYANVFSKGLKVKTKYLAGFAVAKQTSTPRLGLAISKKVCRKASDRNTLKRTIREYFRQHKAKLSGRDFIVMAKAGVSNCPRRELKTEVDLIFSRLLAKTSTLEE